MTIASLLNDLDHENNISVLLETENSKELRIVLQEGHVIEEHQAPYPIVLAIFKGEIEFGLDGTSHRLKKGDIISLEGNTLFNLKANADSIVRLSLSKQDTIERIEDLI